MGPEQSRIHPSVHSVLGHQLVLTDQPGVVGGNAVAEDEEGHHDIERIEEHEWLIVKVCLGVS